MPTVSLRLSEEELGLLRSWAFGSRRSLQREIVFRLFDGALVGGSVPAGGVSVAAAAEATGVNGGAGSSPAAPAAPPTSAPSVRRRPHMKKHRPAVQCPTVELVGGVCPDCGWQEVTL